jgi:hypothetical protein
MFLCGLLSRIFGILITGFGLYFLSPYTNAFWDSLGCREYDE